ncbi:MAG TPA: 6-bladed beta-propeller [Mucilaginibacter sp.]
MNLTSIAKKLTVCGLLIILVSSVTAQKVIPVDSSHAVTLRVDPSNAMGGNVSDFFSKVDYIPLETTKESLFGSISQLQITDDYYIIFDYNTHAILIFTKAGKFHAKIKSSESSPINNFSLNKWTKQIAFSRDRYKTLTYCNYDGKVVNSIKLGGETAKDEVGNYSGLNLFSPDKGFTNSWYSDVDSASKDYRVYYRSLIVFANANHKIYGYGLPFTKAERGLQTLSTGGQWPISDFGVDTAFFYSKAYDSSIYTITPNAITLSYKFIFPLSASLPSDFLSNTDYNKNRIEWIEKHNQAIYCLTNFFRIGNNLIFRTGIWGGSKEDNLIYNLKTGTTIAYKHIQQDERSYFMPIYDQTGWTFDNRGILACKDGCLYTSVSAVGMFKAYKDNAEQKVKYPAALAEYFKTGSIKDNPAILVLKLKDEL